MSGITILAGPCGAGKTHYRTDKGLHPCLDMADHLHVEWDVRLDLAKRKALEAHQKGEDLVIEGIFAPGSPSRIRLTTFLKSNNIPYVVVEVWRPLEACLAAVGDRPERRKVLLATHSKF